jgi:cytochrome c-type biogenesis protein CcmH/NrfG
MGDDRSRGSNAGVVILIAILVLALPCCGGVALVGLGLFGARSVSVQQQPPPPTMQPMGPPTMQEAAPPMETKLAPEPATPDAAK